MRIAAFSDAPSRSWQSPQDQRVPLRGPARLQLRPHRRGARAEIFVFGHTHLPYVKEIGVTLFVNDGSVGEPKDGGTRAAYALLDIGEHVNTVIRRVPYAVAAAAAIRASGPKGLWIAGVTLVRPTLPANPPLDVPQ